MSKVWNLYTRKSGLITGIRSDKAVGWNFADDEDLRCFVKGKEWSVVSLHLSKIQRLVLPGELFRIDHED